MIYQLNLNPKQARVVIEALDVLTRIGMGQLEIVAEHVPEDDRYAPDTPVAIRCRQLDQVKAALQQAKHAIGQPVGGSYGIGNPKTTQESKIAYDIECVLRRAVAIEEHHGSHSVWHHLPMHYGTEPLVTVGVIDTVRGEGPVNREAR